MNRTPSPELLRIHDRMPLILPENVIDSWIDPRGKPNEVIKEVLTDMVFEKAE